MSVSRALGLAVYVVLSSLAGCSALLGNEGQTTAQGNDSQHTGSKPTGPQHSLQEKEAPQTADPSAEMVSLFPEALVQAMSPRGWEPWILHPIKRKTDYHWRQDKTGVVVDARSRSSASGLIKRLDIDPAEFSQLQFSWLIDNLLEGADPGLRESEDSPVRVVLGFAGDKGSLPIKDQAFFERVKLFTGQEMPYATLMYVWDNKRPVDAVIVNPHTTRVKKIVASSGPAGVKTWQSHERNIVADFEKAYGQAPGRLIAIGLLSDTDNTKTATQAKYRGLKLVKIKK